MDWYEILPWVTAWPPAFIGLATGAPPFWLCALPRACTDALALYHAIPTAGIHFGPIHAAVGCFFGVVAELAKEVLVLVHAGLNAAGQSVLKKLHLKSDASAL